MSGWGLRLAGVALALAAGYGWGARQVELAARHTRALDELEAALGFIRAAILYRELEAGEILRQLREECPWPWLGRGEALCDLRPPGGLPTTQREVFAACFSALGRCGAPESVRRLDHCLARCRAYQADARAREDKARRLYRQAGLCVGALAVLLLL